MCPSRELARQTFEVINGYTGALREDGHPELRSLLVMGGVDMKTQARAHIHTHIHVYVYIYVCVHTYCKVGFLAARWP